MTEICGAIRKLRSELAEPIQYSLPVGDEFIPLNPLLGQTLKMTFTGNIFCIQCHRKTSKSFQQGYCFPCFRRLAECSHCMIHPERCHHDETTCRADDWVHTACLQPHIVYLANSSFLKVGVTRTSQVPTRWIDQGAIQAMPIFRTSTRYSAGLIEVALKQHVADKTNWRAMLKGNNGHLDLAAERHRLLEIAEIPAQNSELLEGQSVQDLHYPVLKYPEKIHSLDFDKTRTIEGTLEGIKGQYLIFDIGVINIRKFGGYEISTLV